MDGEGRLHGRLDPSSSLVSMTLCLSASGKLSYRASERNSD